MPISGPTLGKLTCTTCGALGDCSGTIDKCALCWHVESNLRQYLRCKAGREFVTKMLGSAVLENIGKES